MEFYLNPTKYKEKSISIQGLMSGLKYREHPTLYSWSKCLSKQTHLGISLLIGQNFESKEPSFIYRIFIYRHNCKYSCTQIYFLKSTFLSTKHECKLCLISKYFTPNEITNNFKYLKSTDKHTIEYSISKVVTKFN